MAGLDCALVMDALAAAVEGSSLVTRCYAYPTEALRPGEGTVGYPEQVDFDMTFARGADTATFRVWVMCGLTGDPATRAVVSDLIKDAADIKTAIEAYAQGSAYSSVRVMDAAIERVQFADGTQNVMVRLSMDVIS